MVSSPTLPLHPHGPCKQKKTEPPCVYTHHFSVLLACSYQSLKLKTEAPAAQIVCLQVTYCTLLLGSCAGQRLGSCHYSQIVELHLGKKAGAVVFNTPTASPSPRACTPCGRPLHCGCLLSYPHSPEAAEGPGSKCLPAHLLPLRQACSVGTTTPV